MRSQGLDAQHLRRRQGEGGEKIGSCLLRMCDPPPKKRKHARKDEEGRTDNWRASKLRRLFLCRKGTPSEERVQTNGLNALLRGVQEVLRGVEGSSADDALAAAAEVEYVVQLQDGPAADERGGSAVQCKRSVLLAALRWMPEVARHFRNDPYARRLQVALALVTPRYLQTNCQAVGDYVAAATVLAELWGGEETLLPA